MIQNFSICFEFRTNIKEPFYRETVTSRPMGKIAVDFFKHRDWYVIITNCYSRFDIDKVSSMNEDALILKIKQYFSRMVYVMFFDLTVAPNSYDRNSRILHQS